jgi:hypothetical protein
MRYDGTMLITERFDECREFYAQLLGVEPDPGAGWARFRLADGTWIALHTPWRPGMTTTGGSQVLLLEVESVSEEAQRLTAAGIECSEPHDIPGAVVVTITDPDARTIQLVAYSSQG